MIVSDQPRVENGFGKYSSEQYRKKGGRLIHTEKGVKVDTSLTLKHIYIYIHTDVCEKNFNIENGWWETSEMGK